MGTSAIQSLIRVHAVNPKNHKGALVIYAQAYRCALGKHGTAMMKREGDNKTPLGLWPLRAVFYRADRVRAPLTYLPVYPIQENMGWCDDPTDKNYNQLVLFPFKPSAETLWRKDHLYDLMVVLGYNDAPAMSGRGSAIFMHLCSENYAPTEGCIALSESDLRKMLSLCSRDTQISIR